MRRRGAAFNECMLKKINYGGGMTINKLVTEHSDSDWRVLIVCAYVCWKGPWGTVLGALSIAKDFVAGLNWHIALRI